MIWPNVIHVQCTVFGITDASPTSTTVKSAVSDLCCRRPSTVSDRFSVHRRFHIQIDLSRATICCARPATAISCTVAAFKSAVSDRDPRSVRCETVLGSVLSTARCENALSCKCAPIFYWISNKMISKITLFSSIWVHGSIIICMPGMPDLPYISRKRPSAVRDRFFLHQGAVAYDRFDCSSIQILFAIVAITENLWMNIQCICRFACFSCDGRIHGTVCIGYSVPFWFPWFYHYNRCITIWDTIDFFRSTHERQGNTSSMAFWQMSMLHSWQCPHFHKKFCYVHVHVSLSK